MVDFLIGHYLCDPSAAEHHLYVIWPVCPLTTHVPVVYPEFPNCQLVDPFVMSYLLMCPTYLIFFIIAGVFCVFYLRSSSDLAVPYFVFPGHVQDFHFHFFTNLYCFIFYCWLLLLLLMLRSVLVNHIVMKLVACFCSWSAPWFLRFTFF